MSRSDALRALAYGRNTTGVSNPSLKRPQRSPGGFGTDSRERDALLDLKLGTHNQKPFKPVTAEPVKFALEARSVFTHATRSQVRDGFALNSKEAFQAANGIVTRKPCSGSRFKSAKL